MGTWSNGASVNRAKPKQASSTVPQIIAHAVMVEHDKRTNTDARGFIEKFLGLVAGYSHHSGRSHKRYGPKSSGRSAAAIVGEVRAFYSQRPRPWRWHGNQRRA